MMVVILVAGLYLAIDRWQLSDPWIAATFVILIVPSEKRLVALAERDGGAPSAEYDREFERLGKFGALAGLLVVAAIFLMTVKPGA